ncbi:MAG TPA: hypothetical protein VIG71_10575 [Enteractinococcus sp.]
MGSANTSDAEFPTAETVEDFPHHIAAVHARIAAAAQRVVGQAIFEPRSTPDSAYGPGMA